MYIEKYHYNLEFDVENYYKQFQPGIDYDPSWPIVCVSASRVSAAATHTLWSNILAGKARSKPSTVLGGGAESVHTSTIKTLGMRGAAFSVLSACTSGAYALYQAGLLSKDCGTPVVVVAADDIVNSLRDMHYFHSLGAMSEETGIPFDKNSKGFRPGIGQGFFVVSSKPINPIAKLLTMRFFTQPTERTAVGSIEEIQKTMFSDVDLSMVSWWNAHAPGTPIGDKAEYELFNNVCKDIPISSLKGYTGHMLASSYLIELGLALDCVQKGIAKGNRGIITPLNDDTRIIQQDVVLNTKTFLKFNMGFGGKNVLSIIDVFV